MKSLNKEDYEAKDKVFYAAMISAWINTKLERDKQLLGLSVTAIGFLVALLRTVGVSDLAQLGLFSFALFAFLVTIISVIAILGENAAHIEKMLDSSETESKALTVLDKVSGISFVAGMVLIVIIGINSALINLGEKGKSMPQENPSETTPLTVFCKDSWNGISKLRPQPPKAAQTNPTVTPPSNSSETSGSNASSNAGELGNSGSGGSGSNSGGSGSGSGS
jgi:uncharacterized membrane protein YgcG